MTVRAWITISVLVLVALTGAVVYQFTRPLTPPRILVHADDVSLDGVFVGSCWPQRSGDVRCTKGHNGNAPVERIPRSGTFRLVVAYPVQPTAGRIQIFGAKGIIKTMRWHRTVPYNLAPGLYRLIVRAEYPVHSNVDYRFSFVVR